MYTSRFQDYLFDESASSRFEVITKPVHKCNKYHPYYATQYQDIYKITKASIYKTTSLSIYKKLCDLDRNLKNCFYITDSFSRIYYHSKKKHTCNTKNFKCNLNFPMQNRFLTALCSIKPLY